VCKIWICYDVQCVHDGRPIIIGLILLISAHGYKSSSLLLLVLPFECLSSIGVKKKKNLKKTSVKIIIGSNNYYFVFFYSSAFAVILPVRVGNVSFANPAALDTIYLGFSFVNRQYRRAYNIIILSRYIWVIIIRVYHRVIIFIKYKLTHN